MLSSQNSEALQLDLTNVVGIGENSIHVETLAQHTPTNSIMLNLGNMSSEAEGLANVGKQLTAYRLYTIMQLFPQHPDDIMIA